MYQDWMLFVYNFSGVLSARKTHDNKMLHSKFFNFITIVRLLLMLAVNGALLVQPPLAALFFKQNLNGGTFSTFASNTIYISSKAYHGSAIILLIMQLVRSKKIHKYLELIIIRSQSDEVILRQIQNYSS